MILDKLKKFKPTSQGVMTFLLLLLAIDLVLLVFINRKPLCLETSLISHMEWISADGKVAKIYRCDIQKSGTLADVFAEKIEDIQKRVDQLESLLKANFKPKKPIKLVIQNNMENFVQSTPDSVVLDEKNFFTKHLSLERAYIKSWLQQNQKEQDHGLGLLRLDIFTHFLLWNLGVKNHYPIHWQNLLSRWPQMATSWSGYCHSTLKDDIYSSLCSSPSLAKNADSFIPLTATFWLSQKLWQSFQLIPLNDQIKFFKSMDHFIEILSEAETLPINDMTLRELDGFIRNEVQVWKQRLTQAGFKIWGSNFENKVTIDLDIAFKSLGKVDLLVKKPGYLLMEEVENYQALSFDEFQYRIFSYSNDGVRSYPWLTTIRPTSFPSIKATNLILYTCQWPSVVELLDLQEHSDKVIVVQQCDDNKTPMILAGLLHRGLQFFSLDNRDIRFVVINLEALRFLMKKDAALRDKKLGAFPQVNERSHYLAAKANWSSALWNPQYRAYEVQATIDVVEWFKLPENTWPDFE